MANAIRSKALDLLARREHSRSELLQKLLERGFLENEIINVLDTLKKEGLQSDARFVECYISSRSRKGFGPVRIAMELRARDVEDELIKLGLQNEELDWIELAASVRQKKFGTKIPKDFNDKMKQMQFLQYRGFTSDQIKECF